jgi:uncharacterized protein YdaU (DUF1376 family)
MYHYPFHVRDYLTKTRHLSLLEDLAYRRLLDAYYTEESPFPADVGQVARLIAMRDQTAEVEAVLKEFFVLTPDGWRNERCDLELSKYAAKSDSARNANRSRWAAKSDTKSDVVSDTKSDADRIPTKNQEPRTKNQPKPKAKVADEGFDIFWAAYPKKVAKPEALKAWLRIAPDEALMQAIMAGLQRAKQSREWTKDDGQFIQYPSTWLNQQRWTDETGDGGAQAEDHFGGLL